MRRHSRTFIGLGLIAAAASLSACDPVFQEALYVDDTPDAAVFFQGRTYQTYLREASYPDGTTEVYQVVEVNGQMLRCRTADCRATLNSTLNDSGGGY